jgi:hypothetical protein
MYDIFLYFSLHVSQSSPVTLLLFTLILLSSGNFNIVTFITTIAIDCDHFLGRGQAGNSQQKEGETHKGMDIYSWCFRTY